MAKKLSDILDGILMFLIKWRFPIADFLQDGLDESSIFEKFLEIGLTPTDEMIEFYSWKNGASVTQGTNLDDIQFIPGYHLLSLGDAIAQYLAIKDDVRWNESWFPILANGGGDFYAVDLSLAQGGSAPIVGFLLGETEQDIEYQSIRMMMQTFFECCENSIVYRTDEGYLEMDDDKQATVARKNNPNVEFWKV